MLDKIKDWLEKDNGFVPFWKTYLFLPYYLWFCRVHTTWYY